jgi:predicted  nucleic acid-binding Zn-ribbon protein
MTEDTIDKLKALQDILSQKFEIEREIADLPKALSTKTELVNRLKKSYIEKNTQFDETKKRLT